MRIEHRGGSFCRSISIATLGGIVVSPLSGCIDWSSLSKPKANPATAAADAESSYAVALTMAKLSAPPTDADPFAAVELEAGQQPFLDTARPFITAIWKRDYTAAFGLLSPTAKQKFSRNQFIPTADEQQYAKHEAEPILNPTSDQFVQLMQEVEGIYGTPARLDPPTVDSDPDTLSRKDPVSAAYQIGACQIPSPSAHAHRPQSRPGSIANRRTNRSSRPPRTKGSTRRSSASRCPDGISGGEGPYFKLKTVVIDAGAGPVIGYFEIAPRGLLD